MRNKIMSTLALMLITNTSALTASDKEHYLLPEEHHKQPLEESKKEEPAKPKRCFVNNLILAFEERPNYANLYLAFSQLIKDHWYYEMRLYGIRNFISGSQPSGIGSSQTAGGGTYVVPDAEKPHPIVGDQRNQYGLGGVGIFGYVFEINKRVTFMPFFRFETKTNTAQTYRDRYHDQLNSITYNYFLGGKLQMKVNDIFAIYAMYFGGYFRSNFHGKRFYAESAMPLNTVPATYAHPSRHAHYNGLAGTFELGAPYNICPRIRVTPYIQFAVSDNNIKYKYTQIPYNFNPVTSSNVVWAIKVAQEF